MQILITASMSPLMVIGLIGVVLALVCAHQNWSEKAVVVSAIIFAEGVPTISWQQDFVVQILLFASAVLIVLSPNKYWGPIIRPSMQGQE